jgi:hypothetical protein
MGTVRNLRSIHGCDATQINILKYSSFVDGWDEQQTLKAEYPISLLYLAHTMAEVGG